MEHSAWKMFRITSSSTQPTTSASRYHIGPQEKNSCPEILGRVGQAQQKAAGDLDRLADGAGQVLERLYNE